MVYSKEFSVDTFPFWSGARDTFEDVCKADKTYELQFLIEEMFADNETPPTETEINDFVWFDRGYIYSRLGLDENGRPKMQIFNTCRQFIRTIPALPYDLRKVEDVDSEAEDHIYDETRYFLMARPVPVNDPRMPKRKVFDPLAD